MKPVIGIPMGDPAGVGPEIVVKALDQPELYELCRPVVIGDLSMLERAKKACKVNLSFNPVTDTLDGKYTHGVIDLINLENVDSNTLEYGRIQAKAGKAAYEYIERSVGLALNRKIDAVATTPINKEALKAAGIDFIGHTEIYAGLTDTHDPLTLFEVRNMRVFFLTRHMSLKKACEAISYERVLSYIERCTKALRRLGAQEGTMAVAGLNPHSGEHGLFGDEEVVCIEPAVREAKRLGYDVAGPIGADSVFHLALQGRFNSVLSLYHDQGHIATKTLDFERTIALTLDLPFLRASVDHGTAFDIAGKGIASEVSMAEAIRIAAKYALIYKENAKM